MSHPDWVLNHVRKCLYSTLHIMTATQPPTPDYTCTRLIPHTAPHDTLGPPCCFLEHEQCHYHEPFPTRNNQ